MAQSFILGLVLSGACAAEPRLPPYNRTIPIVPSLDFGALLDKQLEWNRKGRKLLEGNIEMYERCLRNADLFTPEMASRTRQFVAKLREEVQRREVWGRELERYQQERKLNPGRETDLDAFERLEKIHRELWGPAAEPSVAPPPRAALRDKTSSMK